MASSEALNSNSSVKAPLAEQAATRTKRTPRSRHTTHHNKKGVYIHHTTEGNTAADVSTWATTKNSAWLGDAPIRARSQARNKVKPPHNLYSEQSPNATRGEGGKAQQLLLLCLPPVAAGDACDNVRGHAHSSGEHTFSQTLHPSPSIFMERYCFADKTSTETRRCDCRRRYLQYTHNSRASVPKAVFKGEQPSHNHHQQAENTSNKTRYLNKTKRQGQDTRQ